ncbi:MAG: hypothetical protein J2P21_15570 [Chloracidobacterium sp.]|nr:hypothetical protein [Chloracidobacterium sp.]
MHRPRLPHQCQRRRGDQKVFCAEIVNGEFNLQYKHVKTSVYTLNNLTDRAKTLYIEHPYDKNQKWRLVKPTEPWRRPRNITDSKSSSRP